MRSNRAPWLLTTLLAIAPMAGAQTGRDALSHAIGSETQRSLAIVVIGGLVSATLLTLLVLPTLYLWVHRSDERATGN